MASSRAVHAHVEPEAHCFQYLVHHQRTVISSNRLVEKNLAVVGLAVSSHVSGFLSVGEDDARVLEFLVVVRPDIHVALGRAGRARRAALKPGVLVAGVVKTSSINDLASRVVRRSRTALKSASVP